MLEDLQRYEPDSSSSEEDDSDDESEDEDEASAHSSTTSTPSTAIASKLNSIADEEFQKEVVASLERAWSEGHTVENAAVELKTLRMASNVPLLRVREAIVRFLLDKIECGVGEIRDKIRKIVPRWGALINAIGGVDEVETIEVLQVRRLPLFNNITFSRPSLTLFILFFFFH
jgi:translation initiation factor eIF-2B subunit epsilon